MFNNDSNNSNCNSNTSTQLDMKEYDEYLNSDEYQKQRMEKFTDNYRLMKSLALENRGILASFSDSEKNKQLKDVVSEVWNGVLENDTELNSVEEIVALTLDTEDKLNLLLENKHKNYFPSGKVFEEHLDHPVQKKLTKGKYLSKREVNKRKTPMQTINYVYSAKSNSDRDARLAKIEESLAEAHYMISMLAVNQMSIGVEVMQQSKELDEVKERLALVEDKIKDKRKLKLYALYTSGKKVSSQELALEVGVNVRTIQRWVNELKEAELIV